MILFLKDNLVVNSQAIAWCKIVYKDNHLTNKLEIHFNGADTINLECNSVRSAKHIFRSIMEALHGSKIELAGGCWDEHDSDKVIYCEERNYLKNK